MEQEAVFILHFNPKPTGGGKVQIKLTSAGVVEPETTTAEGIKKVIIDKFEAAGINDIEIKLIGKLTVVQKSLTVDIKAKLRIQFSGFGANGTTVNRSDKNGVKQLLQEHVEWLVFGWCMSHRLELALKDALQKTVFKEVDEIVLNLYLLYQKAPQKLRQLKELASK